MPGTAKPPTNSACNLLNSSPGLASSAKPPKAAEPTVEAPSRPTVNPGLVAAVYPTCSKKGVLSLVPTSFAFCFIQFIVPGCTNCAARKGACINATPLPNVSPATL